VASYAPPSFYTSRVAEPAAACMPVPSTTSDEDGAKMAKNGGIFE